MAFNPYYQNPYYPQPMPDHLMQMRQQQMMQPAPQGKPVEFVTRKEFDDLAAIVSEIKG